MSGRRLVALLSSVFSVLALTVAGSAVAQASVPTSGFVPRVPAPLVDMAGPAAAAPVVGRAPSRSVAGPVATVDATPVGQPVLPPVPTPVIPQGTPAARSAYTNDFVNSDGTHTMVVSPTALNFQAADGSWQPIDNALVPDPALAGGFTNRANSWRVHFGPASLGVVVDSAGAGSLRMTPVGAANVLPVISADGGSVVYANAWPNVDLVYRVSADAVKESVVIKAPGTPASFTFDTSTGSSGQLLGSAAGPLGVPSFAAQPDGALLPGGALGSQLRLQSPVALSADGTPLVSAGARLAAGTGGTVSLSVDAAWLAGQPQSAFPLDLDPTITNGPDNTADYETTGYSCTGCGLQTGNSQDGGNTDWRSVIHFPYESLFGDQVLAVAIAGSRLSGTANAYWVNAYGATAFSFAGAAGNGTSLARSSTGSSFSLSGSGLTNLVAGWVNAQMRGGNIGFVGDEAPSTYTYQSWSAAMAITYNVKPTMPTVVSPSPCNGCSLHQLSYTFKASSSDSDGDALKYLFRVAEGSDAETNPVFDSGWQSSNSVTWTAPATLWNTTLYWHVYVQDPYWTTGPTAIYSFTPSNHPPAAATQAGSQPGDGATVATTTPTLSVPAASDPDGDTVSYDFTISGADSGAGRASSGWIAATSWTVPAGVLADGQAYQWTVATADGPATTAPAWSSTAAPWSSQLHVNQRLGAGGPTPSDGLAGASVNLANGNLSVSAATHAMSAVSGPMNVQFSYNSQAAVSYGLLGQYYADPDRQWNFATAGTPGLVRVDPTLDVRWDEPGYPQVPPGMPRTQYLVRWTGYLTLPAGDPSGSYQLGVVSDDGAKVFWDGATTPVYSDWTPHGAPQTTAWSSSVQMSAGVPTPVEVDYFNQGGPGQLSLYVQGADSTTAAAVGAGVVPSWWLSPTIASLPQGWTLSLPGASSVYTHAAIGDGVVVLTDSSGAAHTYTATGDGGYRPPAGEDGVLAAAADGTLTLHDSDGTVYTFDAQGNPLTATTAVDGLHPAAATYSYDTSVSPARVTAITDPVSGRAIDLYYGTDSHCTPPAGYDQSVAANLLCGIGFWDGSSTGLYYSGGLLATIAEPGGQYSEFGYTGTLLTSIRSPLAVDWVNADPTNRAAAPVSTDIGYTWVAAAPAGSTNIRPPYSPVSAPLPAGAVPLVTSITAPSPDGTTTTARPEHAYTYVGSDETQVHVAGLATQVDRDVTYDSTGRTLTDTTATGQRSSTTWDAGGQDLPTSVTDAAGRETTTLYDWAERATDSYGLAPAACFQSDGLPVASPPASCGTIAHTHTGYDTDTTGTRLSGLETTVWSNTDQSGAPTSRLTAPPDAAAWTSSEQAALGNPATSASYTGELALPPGSYTFSASVGDKTNDGVRLYLDGVPVLDRWTTLNQAILGDQPTGYWRLADPAGSATAANATTGQAGTATAVTFGAPGPGPVDTATAASFNGTSSQVSIPTGSVPDGTGALTIEAWIKPATTGQYLMIATKDTGGGATNTPYEFRLDPSGHLQFVQADATTYQYATSSAIVSTGAWHHVAVTKASDGTVHLYLDGALDPTDATLPTDIPANTQPVLIGARDDGYHFNGQIADVAIYPNALDDLQIAAHHEAGTATLTATSPVTFTALTSPVAPGSLPAAPAGTPQTLRIDYRNPTAAATLNITATNTSTGAVTTLTGAALDPRYGLPTYSVTDDAGGLPSGAEVTATSYTGRGLDPAYGLPTDAIVDPGGAGHLSLDTTTGYETPGSGYLRETGRALPSGSLTTAGQAHTISYYGDTQTRDNPCPGGATGIDQGGMPELTTEQTPATGPAVASEAVYDAAGQIVAARNPNDGNVWTCTSYDSRGRIAQVTVPAVNGAPARTVSYDYAVGGNPLVSSVTDAQGTLTTTVDLLGRTVAYTDTTGTLTTTGYDQAGRAVTQTSTAPGGGASTVTTAYLDDGRVSTVSLDGNEVAALSYDSNAQLASVSYPTGTGDAGNGTSLAAVTRDPAGEQTGLTWDFPAGHTITDTAVLSQAGRVTSDTTTLDGATSAAWGYGYDNAGRLITATLAAAGARPQVAYSYGFAATGGCGADPAAGLDSARSSQTVTIGTAAPQTTLSCTDYASRLTSATGANAIPASQISYDDHGNLTQLGGQTFTYDASDRPVGITVTNPDGSTQTVNYTLDSAGRPVTRTATGTGTAAQNATTVYAYSGDGDAPDLQLTATKAIGERYLPLPGGALLTARYANPGGNIWAYPNLHGDTIATTDATGTLTGSGYLYDPYGQPLDPATGAATPADAPTTRTGGPTDAWEGQHQAGYENTNGLNAILLGARLYQPAWGQFTSPDPTLGGNNNPYSYPNDPINQMDITGTSDDCGLVCWIVVGVGNAGIVAADIFTAGGDAPADGPEEAGVLALGRSISGGAGEFATNLNDAIALAKAAKTAARVADKKLNFQVIASRSEDEALQTRLEAAAREINERTERVERAHDAAVNQVVSTPQHLVSPDGAEHIVGIFMGGYFIYRGLYGIIRAL